MSMPKPIANFETYLTQKLSASGTEAFIFDVLDDSGTSLNGKTVWVTIDSERCLGVVDAALKKITLSLRGGNPNDSTVEVAALKVEHEKGAPVRITDAHYLLQVTEMLSGDIDLQGVPKLPSARTLSNARDLVDKEFVEAQSIATLSDFATVDAGGLNVNVNAGTIATATGTIEFAGVSSQAMADNSTNYLELDENGNFSSNTAGWTEGNLPLSIVVTSGGDITSISLKRGFLTAPITDNTITDDYTYGATITVNDLVYLDTADAKWKLADGSAAATATGVIGVALEAGVDTDTGKRVQTAGVVTGLSGLTPGWQYVSDTAGALSATPGTYKKVVGYAPNATTLVLIPTVSAPQIEGGNSDLTVAHLNEAATFFGTPYSQSIKTTIQAGEDIGDKDVVCFIGGSLKRFNPIDWTISDTHSPGTGGDSWQIDGDAITLETSNPLKKTFLMNNGTNVRAITVTLDSNFAFSSLTEATVSVGPSVTSANARQFNAAFLEDDKYIVGASDAVGTSAVVLSSLTTTPASGTAVDVAASDKGIAVAPFSASTSLAFTGEVGAGVRFTELDVSSSTITLGSSGSLLTDTDIDFVLAAQRLGDTNFYVIAYKRTTTLGAFVFIAEYNNVAGSFSAGTPVQFYGGQLDGGVRIYSIGDNNAIILYSDGTQADAKILTSSGASASLTAEIDLNFTLGSNNKFGSYLINEKTFLLAASTTGNEKRVALYSIGRDLDSITAIENEAFATGGVSTSRQACVAGIGRSAAFIFTANGSSDEFAQTYDLNLPALIGVAVSPSDLGGNCHVATSGYSESNASFNAGEEVFADFGGNITSDFSTTKKVGTAISTSDIIIRP